MLSPDHHPCQALADLMTLREAFGSVDGRKLAYVGDGNNVARSLAIIGAIADVDVTVAAPPGHQLEPGTGARLTDDPNEAAAGADVLYTDVWVSMGDDEATAEQRRARRSRPTGSTTRCSTAPPRTRSRCTACRPTPARRSRRRCCTASASASGTRRRTGATRRRRSWSGSWPKWGKVALGREPPCRSNGGAARRAIS